MTNRSNKSRSRHGNASRGPRVKRERVVSPSTAVESSWVSETQQAGITVFLSYARADDHAYHGMTQEFKHLLGHFVHAKSGRRITTFRDQDDIKWGDIWLDRLTEEILRASVFIPLLSASYLESEMCRKEFLRFHTAASSLGLTGLLLPVLIVEAPAIFNSSSEDEIVQIARDRQWEVIEDAVLSDPGSSDWKRTMSRLAARFTEAYSAAETSLSTLSGDAFSTSTAANRTPEDEELGLTELMDDFQTGIAAMTEATESLAPAIEAFGAAAEGNAALKDQPTPKEIQLWSIELARALAGPAAELGEAGERLFVATRLMDQTMLRLHSIASEFPPEFGLLESYREMVAPLRGIGEVRAQMSGLLESMRPAEYISVPIRKALRPARLGLTRVSDALAIVESWPGVPQ